VAAQDREAAMRAGVRRSQRLAEGPHDRPRRRGACCRARLVRGSDILFGLWHKHDLRVDLVGVRLRLELDVDDAAEQLGGQIVEAHLVAGDLVHGGLHLERNKTQRARERANLAREPKRSGLSEANRGRARRIERRGEAGSGYLLDVSLREVEDEVPDARDGDERAGAGVPELVEERIPCCCGGLRRRHDGGRHRCGCFGGGGVAETLAGGEGRRGVGGEGRGDGKEREA
jgi:hypothetical protein